MKQREETVRFIEAQMRGETESYVKKETKTHYGYCDLHELLDFIYGKPATEAEHIVNPNPIKL